MTADRPLTAALPPAAQEDEQAQNTTTNKHFYYSALDFDQFFILPSLFVSYFLFEMCILLYLFIVSSLLIEPH